MPKSILFILLTIIGVSAINAQQVTPKEAFLEKWENSKNYLIKIAEAMPEDAYGFKPTERQRSFKEQLIHIKQNMAWLSTTYFLEEITEVDESELNPETKAQIIEMLKKSFDSVSKIIKNISDESLSETVDFFAGPKSKLQILNLLQDHVTHHRGQIIVYLNLKDVVPPNYSGW